MPISNEERRSIKAERVKKIFAETAKKIIIEEGVEAVSVRKVADRAGYTFATIYNHFKSADALLWYTRNLMIGDIVEYMDTMENRDTRGIGSIQGMFCRYLEYFILNPNVFRFFYFHQLRRSDKPEGSDTHIPGGKDGLKAFEFLTASGRYTPEEVHVMLQAMIYCAHGLLTLSISDNDDLNTRDVHARMDEVIQFFLRDLTEEKKESLDEKSNNL